MREHEKTWKSRHLAFVNCRHMFSLFVLEKTVSSRDDKTCNKLSRPAMCNFEVTFLFITLCKCSTPFRNGRTKQKILSAHRMSLLELPLRHNSQRTERKRRACVASFASRNHFLPNQHTHTRQRDLLIQKAEKLATKRKK